ncbi:MAG: short-chain dehydrogenase [Parcubacteria group bacterium Gr01-1014_56]|nr:MAG: short-chain dehydrogenase [Parcubacteria group bacterium Gr01-1014_56]
MANSYNLKRKTVLVTGASGQIGQTLVLSLLKNGAYVYGVDVVPVIDPKFKKLIASYIRRFSYMPADITSERKIKAMLRALKRPVDVLINCAGVGVYTPFEKRTEDELDYVMNTNLKGTILMSKALSREMVKRKKGTIINFGSVYGVTTPDFRIYGDSKRNSSEIYGATKAGIIHFTKYLAVYLAKHGITVNAVSPGGVFRSQAESFVKNYEYKTPLGRMATPEDLVGAILFLASDDARYITGQNLVVDGGFTLW